MNKKLIIGLALAVVAVSGSIFYFTTRPSVAAETHPLNETKAQQIERIVSKRQPMWDELKTISSVKIGEPFVILNDWPNTGDGVCFPVKVNSTDVGSFSGLHYWNNQLIGFQCSIEKDQDAYPESDYFGRLEDELKKINLSSGEVKIFTPKNWSFISNSKICRQYIAYWGIEDEEGSESRNSKVLAYIYNWEVETALAEKQVGLREIATDDNAFFESPEFGTDCKTVTFKDLDKTEIIQIP
ncbi:MAG: hypothetical protein JNM24_09310 [Bdellovibrionaceae bacterium]|nr:hypothetical protein [Pseudobdellovibrionaceae bacterium]